MPRKVFTAGEILTAADVNTNLMDQAVMSFAGTAARGSAIPSPVEGMVAYLDDSNQLEVYDGSNWVGLAGASVGTATPATTAEGDFWLDTNPDGQVLKAYNSGFKNVGPVSNNAVINGDFGIWQRGTSFAVSGYTADRFSVLFNASCTTTRESFSPGELEATGYGDAQFYLRAAFSGVESDRRILYRLEDVGSFAGETVTFSFWAKSASSDAISEIRLRQLFGSGGSATVNVSLSVPTLTSSWARYSATVLVPSISGKTFGANNQLGIQMNFKTGADVTVDTWGWQLEAGSVATPFRLAGGGSKAAELALCQRYFIAQTPGATTGRIFAWCFSTTSARAAMYLPVEMRIVPTLTLPGGLTNILRNTGGLVTPSAVTVAAGAAGGVISFNFTVSGVTTNEIFAATFIEASLDAEL